MATTTPNYGWDVPTSSDYVKLGAVAIETLGDDIDATVYAALNGKSSGKVLLNATTLTSATTVTIDNVFSATYRNYLILMSTNTTGTGTLNSLQLRVGGVTTGGTGYNSSNFYADLTTSGVINPSSASSSWALRNAGPIGTSITMFNPFQTTPTLVTGTFITPASALNSHGFFGGQHTGNTSFDGIQINCTTATGIVRIYGIKDV
jgi:hypothetical protein